MGLHRSRLNKGRHRAGAAYGKVCWCDEGDRYPVRCLVKPKVWPTPGFYKLDGPRQKYEKFAEVLQPETCQEVKWISEEFSALYDFISSWTPAEEDFDSFSTGVQDWIQQFCALGDRRLGHQKSNVTPYMHDFASHIQHVLRLLPEKSLKPYSCTSIEKKNDVARQVTQRHSNNHHAAHDVLLAFE